MSRTLTKHAEIRQWAEARAGAPVLIDYPDGVGGTRTVLQMVFGQGTQDLEHDDGPDRQGGPRFVSWDEWLAVLDEEGLAVLVSDDPSGGDEAEFNFVPRAD